MIVRSLITAIGFRVNQGQFNRAMSAQNRLARSARSLAQGLTMGLTLPLALVGKNLIGAAAQMEVTRTSFTAMLGDAQKAEGFIRELFAFAKESPMFEVKDITSQAKLLLAAGFAAEEVIPNMKMLGNIAAGVNVSLERVVQNYRQVRAAGKLEGREVRDFAAAGIPVLAELSTMLYGTADATDKVRKEMRRGRISYKMVEMAFKRMTSEGGMFYNMQEKLAKTTYGRWQKLKDVMFLLASSLGNMLLPIVNKAITAFEKAAAFVNNLNDDWKTFILILGGVMAAIGPVIGVFLLLKTILSPVGIAISAVILVLSIFLDDLDAWRQDGNSILGRILGDYDLFVDRMTRAFKMLKDGYDKYVKPIMPLLFAPVYVPYKMAQGAARALAKGTEKESLLDQAIALGKTAKAGFDYSTTPHSSALGFGYGDIEAINGIMSRPGMGYNVGAQGTQSIVVNFSDNKFDNKANIDTTIAEMERVLSNKVVADTVRTR